MRMYRYLPADGTQRFAHSPSFLTHSHTPSLRFPSLPRSPPPSSARGWMVRRSQLAVAEAKPAQPALRPNVRPLPRVPYPAGRCRRPALALLSVAKRGPGGGRGFGLGVGCWSAAFFFFSWVGFWLGAQGLCCVTAAKCLLVWKASGLLGAAAFAGGDPAPLVTVAYSFPCATPTPLPPFPIPLFCRRRTEYGARPGVTSRGFHPAGALWVG
ncbi:uncharacterized protein B0H64DRAFT_79721 [Chaetomium fimeti]|uniref:Uncharacterized protein n=1 Tax=Chaetomium fimeti TaxID=1854472 RepID=A0AAE0HLG4_9PEZI|nr:hypothetical protein B0H64DRAFT_79721 [Chaetomium fimeti]